MRDELGLQVHAILQIRELADWLVGRELDGKVVLDAAGKAAIDKHLEAYGGTD